MLQMLISVFLSLEDLDLGHEQQGAESWIETCVCCDVSFSCQKTWSPRRRPVQSLPAGQHVREVAVLGPPERAVTSWTLTRVVTSSRPPEQRRHLATAVFVLLSVRPHFPPNTPTGFPACCWRRAPATSPPRGDSSATERHTHRRRRHQGSRSTLSRTGKFFPPSQAVTWVGSRHPRLSFGINTCWEGRRGFTEPEKVYGTTSGRSKVKGGAQAGTW